MRFSLLSFFFFVCGYQCVLYRIISTCFIFQALARARARNSHEKRAVWNFPFLFFFPLSFFVDDRPFLSFYCYLKTARCCCCVRPIQKQRHLSLHPPVENKKKTEGGIGRQFCQYNRPSIIWRLWNPRTFLYGRSLIPPRLQLTTDESSYTPSVSQSIGMWRNPAFRLQIL